MRFVVETADHMHMGVEDVLAARFSDVPSDRKSGGMKLRQVNLRLRDHLSEIRPLLHGHFEWAYDMPPGHDEGARMCRMWLVYEGMRTVLG